MGRVSKDLLPGATASTLVVNLPKNIVRLLPARVERVLCTIISQAENTTKPVFNVRLQLLPDIELTITGGLLKFEARAPAPSTASSSTASSSTASSSIASAQAGLAALNISTPPDPAPPFDESETDTDDDDDQDPGQADIASEMEMVRDFSWTSGRVLIDSRKVQAYSYTNPTTINVADPPNASPAVLFERFFPTNYASRVIIPATNARAEMFDPKWRRLTLQEFYVWLGMLTAMTVVTLPRPYYWMSKPPFPLVEPLNFGRWISKRRFDAILVYLTLVLDIDGNPTDPLHPFRGFHLAFNSNLADAVVPSTYLTVDESMCAWQGKVNKMPYKKKIARKPHPVGLEFKVCRIPPPHLPTLLIQ
jgi:Transposase IS4